MSHDYLDRRNNTSGSSRNNANEGPAPTHEMLREYLEQRMRRNEMLTAQMIARDEEEELEKKEDEQGLLSASNTQKDELDYKLLANRVFKAMQGFGTDENAVYNALSQLNKDEEKIKAFKSTYNELYGRDVVLDINNDFSNSALFGNEYDKAINFLIADKTDASIGSKKSGIAKNPDSESQNKDDVVSNDARKLRETFGFSGWISGSVGKDMQNDVDDVRRVAQVLEQKEIKNIPEESKLQGKCNEKFIKAIKQFQKSVNHTVDGKIGAHGGTIRALLGYSSGLKQIYPSRNVINAELRGIELTAGVGQEIESDKPENKPADVKYIAYAIKTSGIDVPEDSLKEGKSSQAFIDSIKEFQKKRAGLSKPDGNIGKGGYTYKKIRYYHSIGTIKRDKEGNYGKSKDPELYYNTIDLLSQKLGIKEGSKLQAALQTARKAATDSNYFGELTKDINEKMTIADKEIEAGGIKLSSVLEQRMRRFHKFLVAAGLYVGDMSVSDGVRSPQKAHQFAVQYYILTGKAEEAIKQNLIKLYNAKNKAEDMHNNLWAKKAHFSFDADGKAISVDFKKVQKYVEGLDLGRSNKTSPAAVGHKYNPQCLPLPEGKEPSAHTKGLALDIDSHRFVNKKESMIDLIALNFGLVRNGGAKETWHFELSNLGISAEEKKIINTEKR